MWISERLAHFQLARACLRVRLNCTNLSGTKSRNFRQVKELGLLSDDFKESFLANLFFDLEHLGEHALNFCMFVASALNCFSKGF